MNFLLKWVETDTSKRLNKICFRFNDIQFLKLITQKRIKNTTGAKTTQNIEIYLN